MHYVMADIHGEYDRYQAMLDKIQPNMTDNVYIIGDIIDRKPDGIKIAQDIMRRRNFHFIKGNHELMCVNDILYHEPEAKAIWHMNGSGPTRRALMYKTNPTERMEILKFFRDAPDHMTIRVNGQDFYLVHGWPGHTTYDRVWTRPEPDWPAPIENAITIIGHTCVYFLGQNSGKPFQIGHYPGFIAIDCGCGNNTDLRRLACICLDTMQEFYV